MESDLLTVRAEIKAWERNFRSLNGRHPSIQDIRDNPPVESNYKLYKKLSKLGPAAVISSSNKHSTLNPPSTPPRSSQSRDKSALLLSNPRALDTTAPLVGFNPFSPAKNKGKRKETTRNKQKPSSNPFATPVKGNAKLPATSPDAFPVISLLQQSTSNFEPLPPPLNSAVARARKRLRGDPVSPSPNKQKRRRVGSQTSLPFPKLDPKLISDDDQDEVPEVNSSFVDDSPVKAPAGRKSFKLLFEETVPSNKGAPARRKATPAGGVLFGARAERVATGWELASKGSNSDVRRKITKGRLFASRILPGKSDLLQQQDPKPNLAGPGSSAQDQPERRTSSKRSLSDSEMDLESLHNDILDSWPTLLPPSPPAELSNQYTLKTKGKGNEKAKAPSWKKTKVDEDDERGEGSETSEDGKFKVIDLSRRRNLRPNDDADDFELDPILARRHAYAHSNDVVQEGTFEVDLPDKLRNVLALSPSKSRSSKDERVVSALLHGLGKFDHGAEIWAVGEDIEIEHGGSTDGEGDWEGEGVPWEVGEM